MRYISVLIVLFTSVAVCFDFVHAQTLTTISVQKASDSTQVNLTFDEAAPSADTVFVIKEGRPRLVMDFKQADYSLKESRNRIHGEGLIKAVRFARRGNNEQDMRVVFDLTTADIRSMPFISGNVLTMIVQDNPRASEPASPARVQVEAPAAKPETAAARADISAPRYFKGQTPYPRLKPLDRAAVQKPARKPVIVIDPGHGGYDPGAIGAAGTQEKKITYAASIELQRQLLTTGRYEVIITRTKDVYVPHEERLRLARAGSADLFISIHADATANGSARGASVYTLADRALTRSKRLVNSQNWIMDVDLSEQSDPVGDILVDLAQRKTASQSDEFAEVLITELAKSTKLIGNTHRRAGYFVLLAPDVPAVLLELGFISNSEDEKLLNKEKHRKKVITSVTNAINSYFNKQKS